MVTTVITDPYSLDQLKIELPPRLRSMMDALYEEIVFLQRVEDKPIYDVTPEDSANYHRWRTVAMTTCRDIVREFPYYRDEIRKLADTAKGLKDTELP